MMFDQSAWKNNSDDKNQVYDYQPPRTWSSALLAKDKAAQIAALEQGPPDPSTASGWLILAWRLPTGLRAALAAELAAGNQIATVSCTGWPQEGSVVITMHKRFTAARWAPPPGVKWTKMDCPHHWREDLSESKAGTDFVLMA